MQRKPKEGVGAKYVVSSKHVVRLDPAIDIPSLLVISEAFSQIPEKVRKPKLVEYKPSASLFSVLPLVTILYSLIEGSVYSMLRCSFSLTRSDLHLQ